MSIFPLRTPRVHLAFVLCILFVPILLSPHRSLHSRTALRTAAPAWQWNAGPDLTFPHMGHTATLLPDGRVVVIGGLSDWTNGVRLGYAEIFDPVTNSWSLAPGQSSKPRYQHTATLLQDGRILVVGGSEAFGGVVDSAEIFDPATGLFTPIASPGGMKQHSAVALLDGDVLVFGGQGSVISAWRYNVANNQWSFAGNGPGGYDVKAVRLDNGKVVAGGEIYDPATNTWSASAAPPDGWYPGGPGGAGVAVNGAAGFSGFGIRVTYFSDNTWSSSVPQLISRSYHAATVVDGAVMQVGGWDENFDYPLTVEIAGQAAGSIQTGRVWHTATTLRDGRVLVVGGQTSGNAVLKSVEIGVPSGFATNTPTPTPTVTPTVTNTPTPTVTPTATLTPTPTAPPRTDGVIAGRVWKDEGTWAVQDGEPGLPGISVLLYTNQGGGLVDQTTTDVRGHYTFTHLAAAPGIVYSLAVTGPAGHAFVEANVGGDDSRDSDIESSQPAGADPKDPWIGLADVAMDGIDLIQSHWDAGVHHNSISGQVWWDHDRDGIQDNDEPGLEGMAIVILPASNAVDWSSARTVTSAIDGGYTLANLPPGEYWTLTLSANDPGYRPTQPNKGSNESLDNDALADSCFPAAGCWVYTPAVTVPTNGSAPPVQDYGFTGTGYLSLQAGELKFLDGRVIRQDPLPANLAVSMAWQDSHQVEWPLGTKTVGRGTTDLIQLIDGQYVFVWPKLTDYLLWPPSGVSAGEPDPATGRSLKRLPIRLESRPSPIVEALYYRPGASGSATPGGGGFVNTSGNLRASAAQTPAVSLGVPPGAVTQTVTLHLTDLAASADVGLALPSPAGYAASDFGFLWDVSVGDVQQNEFTAQLPVSVTISYDEAGLGNGSVAGLTLLRWDGSGWGSASAGCAGETAQHVDTEAGQLTTAICRTGRYGLFSPQVRWPILLPFVAR